MRRLLVLAAAAALLAPGCAREATPDEQDAALPDGVLGDDWHIVRFLGHDSGYVRTRVTKDGDLVETMVDTYLAIKRMDAEIKIGLTETTVERLSDGKPVRIRRVQKMSDYVSEAAIRFEGTKAFLTTTVAGTARETERECGEGLVGPYRLDRLTRGLKQGASFEARMYITDLGGPTDLVTTVLGPEVVDLLDGKREKLTRVETAFKKLPLKPLTWVDAKGVPRKTHVTVAGIAMESFSTTEERARNASGQAPEAPPDLFASTLIAPKHPIPSPRRLDRATYRIRSKDEIPDLADGRQSVEKQEDGSALLRIERKVPAEGRAAVKPGADLASCLAPNSMVQSDAPEIVAIAREARGDDAWKVAQGLERWVHQNITQKSMDIGFASALEVCRNRQGDCTEHAVLLCALCRAAGTPSRVAMGVVCIGHAFGGHAWTEVWIDGDWYQLDATLGQGSVDPTHITLGRMALEDNASAEGFIGLVNGLGNLEIEPVEVVLEGRTLRPGDAEHVRIDGRRYENRLFHVAFTCPDGFKFDAPRARATMTARLMELDGRTASGKLCEIEVEVADAAAWDELKKALGASEETTVDGRKAFRVAPPGRLLVCALANDALYIFELDRVEGDAEVKAFEAFVASVDFDVK